MQGQGKLRRHTSAPPGLYVASIIISKNMLRKLVILTARSYPVLKKAGWQACTVSSIGQEVALAQLKSKGNYFTFSCVSQQPPQWGYFDLCQQNCWHKSEQLGVTLGCSGGRLGYGLGRPGWSYTTPIPPLTSPPFSHFHHPKTPPLPLQKHPSITFPNYSCRLPSASANRQSHQGNLMGAGWHGDDILTMFSH